MNELLQIYSIKVSNYIDIKQREDDYIDIKTLENDYVGVRVNIRSQNACRN